MQSQDIDIQSDLAIKELLAKAASAQLDNEQVSSIIPYISIKGGKFALGENKLGNSIEVIVLATAYDNAYYAKAYEPKVTASPDCFAVSLSPSCMTPHSTAISPQHTSCDGCPKNEYETAMQGSGKACKNNRRLLLAACSSENDINLSNLALLRIPPTSLKPFKQYMLKTLAHLRLPSFGAITRISFDQNSTWPKLSFEMQARMQDITILQAIVESMPTYEKIVSAPYINIPDDNADNMQSTQEAKDAQIRKSKMS
jgi:hypothetical protein